jgi:hypothetical protein
VNQQIRQILTLLSNHQHHHHRQDNHHRHHRQQQLNIQQLKVQKEAQVCLMK